MKAFLLYALSLVAFCATGAVGCHAKRKSWFALACTLSCLTWTVVMIYALFTWLAP